MAKRTPLYDIHVALGGTMVEFAGYELPVQYPSGIIKEHTAVRTAAGLFDVSHMGEFFMEGAGAEAALNLLLTNDIRGMRDGQVRYSILPNDKGGAVDDVLIYRYHAEKYLVVVNAANREKDAAWIEERLQKDVVFKDLSDAFAQLALQGPKAEEILAPHCDKALPEKYYSFIDGVRVFGIPCIVSKTGYTGEAGYELYCLPGDAETLYRNLLEAGAPYGLIPAGLGARDTLRLEAGMPLYGHELREDIPVNEVALDFAIKLGKEDFIGKSAILSHVPLYTRTGGEVLDKGIVREGAPLYCNGEPAGYVTSGTYSPTLGKAIAVLRVKKECVGKELFTEVRGRKLALKTVNLPFDYKKTR